MVKLKQSSRYPWDGSVQIDVSPDSPALFTVAVRIPGWCRNAKLSVNGRVLKSGYAVSKGYAKEVQSPVFRFF